MRPCLTSDYARHHPISPETSSTTSTVPASSLSNTPTSIVDQGLVGPSAYRSAYASTPPQPLVKDFDNTEKLAIVYATPPLSPSAQRSALDPSLSTAKGRSTGTVMDSNDRRRRQQTNAPPYAIQSSPQYPSASGSDRFRQSILAAQSPTSAPSQSRSGGTGGGSSGIQGYGAPYPQYGESAAAAAAAAAQFAGNPPMQSSSLQYQAGGAEYGQQDSKPAQQGPQSTPRQAPLAQASQQPQHQQSQQQQQQSQQSYHQQYGSNIMYNVGSSQQQAGGAAPPSPYDPVQQYPARHGAAIEVLSNQFGVTPQYYGVPGEAGPSSAPGAAMGASPYTPLSYTSQGPVVRDGLAPAYATGMSTETSAAGSHSAYGQSYAAPTAAEVDQAFVSYQNGLKRTFECVRDGRLADAGTTLASISEWLLTSSEALVERATEIDAGLVRDDESMHADRLQLWNEFNTCWLSVLQKQKDMTLEWADTGQRPHPPQSLIEYDQLETMGKELVRLCDMMEKHGLVDYQMGVWEEEIILLLTNCLDLLEEQGASTTEGTQASSTRRR